MQVSNIYRVGHVTPWWKDEYKSFFYQYRPLTNTDDKERWEAEGYGGLHLNGADYNTKDMGENVPAIGKPFFNFFPWENVGVVFYRMNTCDVLPLHRDSYNTYKKLFNIQDPMRIWRCIFFLEDWKSGHYFEIDNRPLMPWKAGDWVAWNNDVLHYAGNFGTESRYTVQVTGMTA